MKFKKHHFDSLKSTNETAFSYEIGDVIIADKQTGGRGRYGKTWESPLGNLYMSIVLPDFGVDTGNLAFVLAVSVANALQKFGVCVKWPNDILLEGKKLVGILLERHDDKIIAGIGVNVASSPKTEMAYETADLGGCLSVEEVSDLILSALSKALDVFQAKGLGAILEQWKHVAVGMGEPIRVNLPQGQIHGIFRDLSVSGALLLELPDKTITEITAGAVFFDTKKGK